MSLSVDNKAASTLRLVPLERSSRAVVDTVQSIALAATAALVFGSVALLAAVHVADRYFVNHVSGSWLTLARFVHHGTVYPPLHQGDHTFGTFYMPLPFLAHGALSLVTGEYLVSGKLTAYATAAILFGLLFVMLRAVGCAPLAAAALVAAVVATPAGYLATMSIRGDSLSVVFQLAALGLVWRTQSRRAVLGASGLCALAIASKTTAVWAPVAIGIWLVLRDRRTAALFTATFIGATAAVLGLIELVSGGRWWQNISELAFSQPAVPGSTPLSGVSTFVHLAFLDRDAPWLLFAVAVLAAAASLRRREISLFQLALGCSLLVLAVVLRDAGADFNHLLDMSVLSALVVGELWGRPLRRPLALALSAVVVVGTMSAYLDTIRPDIGQAARIAVGRGSDAAFSTHTLRGIVRPGDRVLSEDPSLPILAGEVPVTDPSILPRLERNHPDWIQQLQREIATHRFDEVVLIRPLDTSSVHSTQSFGRTIMTAIAHAYRFKAVVPAGSLTYYVYGPR